jgi:Xanthosine triphosphate pyrophosphatase
VLGGAPGVHSARYAGPQASDGDNNARLLDALRDHAEAARAARFVCLMVYLRHAGDPLPVIAEGLWHGRILHNPRGHGGFGYDPLFFVPDQACSAAELEPARKNRLSHRAKAAHRLLGLLHEEERAA